MLNFYDYIKIKSGFKELPLYVKKITDRISEKFLLNNIYMRILIVTMPPRSLKTTVASKYFPEWVAEQFPNKNIGLFSYSEDMVNINIENLSKVTKNKIHNVYEANHSIKKTDILIVDDYFKSIEDINFPLKPYKHYLNYIFNNLNPNPFILIMASRWDKNDMIGHILKDINNFLIDYINIPALALEYDIFGRKQGESFWPEKYPKEVLLTLKDTVGEKWFETMFQGNPK